MTSDLEPAAGTPVLEVRDLAIEFPTGDGIVRAVDGISFTIGAGETLGLVGESGSGKSVTALAALGLLTSRARVVGGSILFLGREILGMDEGQLRRLRGGDLSIVFQDPMTSLNPVIRIREQVEEVIAAHARVGRREVRRRGEEVLLKVGIPASRLDDYPVGFSGGMRERVLIAIAIANRPRLVIADEPTTALDVTIQAQILGLLRQLNAELGTAMVLISHNLGVVAQLCRRVCVMYAGQIVEQGPIDRIFREPEHPYTVGLLRSMPRLDADRATRLVAITGRPPDMWARPEGCPFHPRCPVRIERCTVQRPPMLEVRPAHLSACWVAQAGGSAAVRPDVVASRLPDVTQDGPLRAPDAALLELRALTKHFPVRAAFPWAPRLVVHAADEVDLTIARGTTLGLVGESGCGKSTLARVVLGVYPATSGAIVFEGRDVTRAEGSERRGLRRRMQMIWQDPHSSLDPRMTVARIIAEPLEVHHIAAGREKVARVGELLELVGLSARLGARYPHEFSGGQRQRIGIARALAVEPALLVCDEPLSSLDVSVQAQIVNLLEDLQRKLGLTYLLISHDLAVVRHLSEQVAVMYLGRIVEVGPSEEITARPLHPYTAGLLASVPDPARRRFSSVVPGDVPSPITPPAGCRFHTRCPIGPLRHPDRSICIEVEPRLTAAGPGRTVACHFAGEASP